MRQKETLRYDQTLFRDRDVFEFTYLPDEIYHRDAQIRELALLARPAVRGGSTRSAILRGPRGTGKTTTVRRLFAEIEETTQQDRPGLRQLPAAPDATRRLRVHLREDRRLRSSVDRQAPRGHRADSRQTPRGTERRAPRLPGRRQLPARSPAARTTSSTGSSACTSRGMSANPASSRSRATYP